MEDQRDILRNEEPFSYRSTKDGKALISWRGKQIMIAVGKDAAAIERAAATGDPYRLQLCLAKLTGHFKHGNER